MISVLLPTRKRFASLSRTVDSLRRCSYEQPEIVIYIDDDDIETVEKTEILLVKRIIGPKLIFSDYYNKCYEQSSGDILVMAADDIIFRTLGWDELVEEEFAKWTDKIVMVYGDDKLNISVPSHPILHRRWAEVVGYFSPPYFTYGGCDIWVDDVAKFLGRKRALPFVMEHMHPDVSKNLLDKTYIEGRARSNLRDLYYSMAMQRLADAAKLQAEIDRCIINT